MNTLVNFEIAKLLKEKGFEGSKSPLFYYTDGQLYKTFIGGYKGLKCWNTWEATQGIRWDAPTIAEVVMWLYEKHGIWVEANYLPNVEKFAFIAKPLNFKKPKEFASYREYHNATKQFFSTEKYETPTEAYEAGIIYTLENLIKN